MALVEPSIGSITTSRSGSPKSTTPRLLADGGEPRARVVQLLQLREDHVLGHLVDLERVVTALAARAGLDHPLGDRRLVGEHQPGSPRLIADTLQASQGQSRRPCEAYPTAVPPLLVPTSAQREAVEHLGGPLLVLGGAGTGKTTTLVERFAQLAQDLPADALLALTLDADPLRERIEARLTVPYDELTVTTFGGLCARLLRDEALEAGIDPFATPVSAADRLAMLLEHINALPLRHHDLRGNPSAALGEIVRRVDHLKEELVSAADYRAWAARLPEDAHGAREREFAALFAAHDGLLGEAGALDAGDLVLHAFRLLREKPHVRSRLAARYRHVLIDELQDASFAQGLLLRLLVAEHGGISAFADDDQAIHRYRGAATKNIRDFRAEWPLAKVVRLETSLRSSRRVVEAAQAVVAPIADRLEKVRRRARRRRRGRVLALRVRARAGAGRGGGRRAADRARRVRAGGHLRARALGPGRGPGGGGGVRGARRAVLPERRRGVLPARRGARPDRLAAAARRPGRRGRGGARAGAARRWSCGRSTSRG